MQAAIEGITYYLPERRLTNAELAVEFPDWTPEKIAGKTGIAERRIASPEECSSDLAYAAARQLFQSGACAPSDIDFVLFCTQSPDYFLPTTACLLQQRLELSTSCGALDFNLGCSGWVYGLGLAKGLVESGQAGKVLLLTAETYSKYLDPEDRGARTIFGDGAAATLVSGVPGQFTSAAPYIGPVVCGTEGSGGHHLIVRQGGSRGLGALDPGGRYLSMNGPEIFTFTLRVVPSVVRRALENARLTLDSIDLVIFHQANQYMLDHLRKKLAIPAEKFVLDIADCGNTVSSTIPIALARSIRKGIARPGNTILTVGFGVGLSWAASVIRLPEVSL
jgi:3-oxoacyl-[acyl-carrier-protein] synthase III